MPASLVYSKSVIECLLHCLLNIPRNIGDAFFYVITCVYTSWKTVVLLFLFHVLDCNAIFANQDLLPTYVPTLRPGNFDLHTKMPGSAPAWAVVHKCPVCADLLLVGRRSERLCRRLVTSFSVILCDKRIMLLERELPYTLKSPTKQLTHTYLHGKFTEQILYFGTNFCLLCEHLGRVYTVPDSRGHDIKFSVWEEI